MWKYKRTSLTVNGNAIFNQHKYMAVNALNCTKLCAFNANHKSLGSHLFGRLEWPVCYI